MHMQSDNEKLLTFRQAANNLCVSLRQFRRLVDSGRIAFVRVSERSPRVRSTDILKFVSNATVQRSNGVQA
jgi:excisionase family DNA binding protein